jgi:hypothetical protein
VPWLRPVGNASQWRSPPDFRGMGSKVPIDGTFPGDGGTRIGGWCGSTNRDVTGGTQGLAEPLRPQVAPSNRKSNHEANACAPRPRHRDDCRKEGFHDRRNTTCSFHSPELANPTPRRKVLAAHWEQAHEAVIGREDVKVRQITGDQ